MPKDESSPEDSRNQLLSALRANKSEY